MKQEMNVRFFMKTLISFVLLLTCAVAFAGCVGSGGECSCDCSCHTTCDETPITPIQTTPIPTTPTATNTPTATAIQPASSTPPRVTTYEGGVTAAKPVIYLYPEEEMQVSVKLDFNGRLTSVYPAYNDGWRVIARPDGTLTNLATGREHYCLFWEGDSDTEYDMTRGFVVSGEQTEAFLEDALEKLGLTELEANEFIIYWLPKMEGNAYNLISFQGDIYTDNAALTIVPQPDSILRVFMAWQALDTYIEIEPQIFESFERVGFTVVEWGGAEIK